MNKLQKLINMIFHGKEYDDMKGWERILQIITAPLFILLQVFPNKEGKTEWAIVFGAIIAIVILISHLIANIISAI